MEQKKRKPTTRKKKRKVARIKDHRFWKNFFIMVSIAAAVILSMIIFFKVRTVDAAGMEHYTAQQIIDASGIQEGDNLLMLSKAEIAGRIRSTLPYVSQVQIKRELPNRVILAVEEFEISYAIKDNNGNDWLMTTGGKLLEQVDARQAKQHIPVGGFTVSDPVAGSEIVITANKENAAAANVQKAAVVELLTLLEETSFADHVQSVEVPASFELSFQYDSQYRVLLGSSENLQYKLDYFVEVLKSLDSYTAGEIDLSFSSEQKAIFRAAQ